MRSWYIITDKEELAAAFVSWSWQGVLHLNCRDKVVMLVFDKPSDYNRAKKGKEVRVLATSKARSVYCNVVFRSTGVEQVISEKKRAISAKLDYNKNIKIARVRWGI